MDTRGGRGREAIVLAGGRGTRLAAVLPSRQKVTAEVRGEPFALRLARWLAAAGVERIVFAAGHRSEDVQAIVAAHRAERPQLAVSVEDAPLGTGGAVRLAAEQTSAEPVLVLNGDSFAEVDIDAFYAFHAAKGAAASLALARVEDTARYGAVDCAPDGAVRSFREKLAAGADGAGVINAGVYLFSRAALETIPLGQSASLETDVFPKLVGKGLYGMGFEGRFIDIGTPESLAAAETFFQSSAA